MNNLWIRMQGNKEKSKREKERVDLKITVGENLSRLSKLHGVNKDIYLTLVFPRLADLIEASKDTIS
jgi:vacuolar protein sorting-associated protein 35